MRIKVLTFGPIQKKHMKKDYLLSKDTELFKSKMSEAITRRKATHIRIHDSGDFYNFDYIKNWFEIMLIS